MGELAAFSIEGMKIWFWSKDHNPPHFHVKRDGQYEYRVFFLEEGAATNVRAAMGQIAFESRQKAVDRERGSASRRDP